MKIRELILKNFRGYGREVRIAVDDLTVFIGKNDVGKSTVLEALNAFFNEKEAKLETADLCVYIADGSKTITIGCVFEDLPSSLTIDATASTSLNAEFILNSDSYLEIHKEFDCSVKTVKSTVYAVALHPSATNYNDLLSLKNQDLKSRIRQLAVDDADVNLSSNVQMRQAIWGQCSDLQLTTKKIQLDKGDDLKAIWGALSSQLPIFALFKADRQSSDEDSEVQDPMKLAIAEALSEVEDELLAVKQVVREKVEGIANATLNKLREMDPELASELSPNFKAEPKWDGIFKLSLTGDDQIPINKRGSGVRRLILLNFFRAEVERRMRDGNASNVIYAIEEPETAQHPDNQKRIVETLIDLAEQPHCQILLTTHVPGLAGLVPVESIRYIKKVAAGHIEIGSGTTDILEEVSAALGVLPNIEDAPEVRIIVCVEGKHDINCIGILSNILFDSDPSQYVDILRDKRVVTIPLGGSSLQEWVSKNYLAKIGVAEWHLYDRDIEVPPKYERSCAQVNARGGNHSARLTLKREVENYLHSDAISEALGIVVAFTGVEDVPNIVAKKLYEASGEGPWSDLSDRLRKRKEGLAKTQLNLDAAMKMTPSRLDTVDPGEEVKGWLRDILRRIS